MRALAVCSLPLLLASCVGGPTSDLPGVAAPIAPLPTVPSAETLSPIGATTLTGTPGSSVTVQVRATKADGTPVNSTPIAFEVQLGGGSATPTVTATAGEGVASAKWTFGSTPGVNLLKVSGGAAGAAPVTFTASTIAASENGQP
jgi:hypothetical protein